MTCGSGRRGAHPHRRLWCEDADAVVAPQVVEAGAKRPRGNDGVGVERQHGGSPRAVHAHVCRDREAVVGWPLDELVHPVRPRRRHGVVAACVVDHDDLEVDIFPLMVEAAQACGQVTGAAVRHDHHTELGRAQPAQVKGSEPATSESLGAWRSRSLTSAGMSCHSMPISGSSKAIELSSSGA